MSDLAAFLAARLDEDEAIAKATVEPHNWHNEHLALHGRLLAADGAHIARHDPARVLREVAAKRAILAEHGPYTLSAGDDYCRACGDVPQVPFPCATLQALGAIWSDHPDYDEAWRT